MKAIVLSDIHGDEAALRVALNRAWQRTGPVDAYFCLGDGVREFERQEMFLRGHDPDAQMFAVRGNNDFASFDTPDTLVVPFGGTKVFLTHGHYLRVKQTLEFLDRAAEESGCTVALYGHTHHPDVETRSTLMINPGAVCDGRLALLEITEGRPRVSLLSC